MRPQAEIKFLEHENTPIPIVADAVIGQRDALGGRLIPLVILDTSMRPDVAECIRIHHTIPTPGDAMVQWGQFEGKETTVLLWLSFVRPSELNLLIEFNIVGQGMLVSQALHGKALYIQAGRPGDRFKHEPNRPKVLVEIVDTGYQTVWVKILEKQYVKHFRAQGLSRLESRRAAAHMIKELQSLNNFRMREKID